MGIPNRQIGWSQEAILLHEVSKQLEKLAGLVGTGGGGGSGTVISIIPGTNITVDNTNPAHPIVSSTAIASITAGRNMVVDITDPLHPVISTTADDIIVVATYANLPTPASQTGNFYWVSTSTGSKWIPVALGGNFRDSGLYYSNGVTWEFLEVPFQATQAEVNAGTVVDKFVTPATLANATILTNVMALTSYTLLATDLNKRIITTNAATVTITIPTGLPSGFICEVYQQGAGQVLFVASGTVLHYSTFELASIVERYGIVGIDNISNVVNEFNLYGKLTSI